MDVAVVCLLFVVGRVSKAGGGECVCVSVCCVRCTHMCVWLVRVCVCLFVCAWLACRVMHG